MVHNTYKYHYNVDGSGESFYDIKFRFPHPYPDPYEGSELQRYAIDWFAMDVGNAWAPGQGDAPPAVPEPATLALLGLGGLLIRRKRLR